MSDIADVLSRLNELGRTDLAEAVIALMGERDGLSRALGAAKTVIQSKDKAYSLIQQRWDGMAAKASTVDSERECNERLTHEIDSLRAELDALRKQEPAFEIREDGYANAASCSRLPVGTKLYAAPVPAAVPDGGLLWSFLRNVMQQGEAIAKDHADATNLDGYERHSARLDAAASKRADELIELLRAAQAPQPAAVPDGVARDAARYRAVRDNLGHIAWTQEDSVLIGVSIKKDWWQPYYGDRQMDFDDAADAMLRAAQARKEGE